MERTQGAILFERHIDTIQRKHSEVAAALDVPHSSVRYWIAGAQRPRSESRTKIARWSNGAVPEDSWISDAERLAIAGGKRIRQGSGKKPVEQKAA